MKKLLLINPHAGKGVNAPELAAAAELLGIQARVLTRLDNAEEVARDSAAEVIGMAGGDGSLGPIAKVAVERGIPFVCIPFGTRNHFARDVGLDRNDPIAALAAFDGGERRIDIGRAGDEVFLNNVSIGIYARLVERRERHRRRGVALARLRALALLAQDRHPTRLTLDGVPLTVRLMMIANNPYDLSLLSFGKRHSLDSGSLCAYVGKGLLPGGWEELPPRPARTVDSTAPDLIAARDGDPIRLRMPAQLSVEHLALRLLLPAAVIEAEEAAARELAATA